MIRREAINAWNDQRHGEMYTVNERLHRQINPDRRLLVAVKEGGGGQLSNTKTLFNFRPGEGREEGRGLGIGFHFN